MSLPEDSDLLEPTPEALAERLLDLGDPDTAIEVLDRALRRDPGSDRARALRSRALLFKRNEHALTPRPSAVGYITEELAEAFIQRGFLEEAQVVYRRVLLMTRQNPNAVRRAELLSRVLAHQTTLDMDPRQRRAEDLVAVGRLASALAEYRVLARDKPDDPAVVGRANDLRMLVLGRDAPQRKTQLTPDITTAVGASPRAAAAMIEEGKLEEALVELQRLALARPEITLFAEAVSALDRLIQSTAGEELPESGSPSLPTRPVRQVSFAEIHIRLGNFAAAAELCRGMVERSPADELSRQRLEDLRTMTRFIVQVRDRKQSQPALRTKSVTGPGAPAPDVPLRKSFRSDFTGYRPSTEPGVIRSSPFRADEDVTAVVRPEEQAELYVRQGFFEKAAEIYRTLVVRHPSHLRFQERLVYIERKIREQSSLAGAAPSEIEATHEASEVDVDVTHRDPEPPESDVMSVFDRPTTAAPVEEEDEALVFRPPPTDARAVSAVRMRPRVEEVISSDPLAEADEKTPITPHAVFEDQPTGRDALADGRTPRREASGIRPSRPTPTAPSSAPVMSSDQALESAPTTALPQIRRGPAPGLVRESAAGIPAHAPPEFEGDPGMPTVPARPSDVSKAEDSGASWEEGVSFDSEWGAGAQASGEAVEYPVQDDGIAAYGAEAEPTDDEGARVTPLDGTPADPAAAEPASSSLATVAMPQMTLPITPITKEDGAVTMRQIIVVGPKPKR